MIKDLMYIELKAGYSDNGPAWIGYVKTSKTKKTIYFNDHAFQKYNGGCSNYVDIETGRRILDFGFKKERE
ncbi:MAG: hypothetical protein ACLTSZ_05880 [Lachnospiraceae bacterium]